MALPGLPGVKSNGNGSQHQARTNTPVHQLNSLVQWYTGKRSAKNCASFSQQQIGSGRTPESLGRFTCTCCDRRKGVACQLALMQTFRAPPRQRQKKQDILRQSAFFKDALRWDCRFLQESPAQLARLLRFDAEHVVRPAQRLR